GTTWTASTFGDSTWKSGPAPLGYGVANDGPSQQAPATTNSFGPDSANKYITTYYRRAFTVASKSSVANMTVSIQRDDGAIVYINGVEVFRSNMPAGPITYSTLAATVVGTTDEITFYSQPVDPVVLVDGTNTLAVEIHQANVTSSDIMMDLEL